MSPPTHLLTRDGDLSNRVAFWNLPHTGYYQSVASMAAHESLEPTLAGLQELLVARTGRTDLRLHDLRSIALHQVPARMVQRVRIGRATSRPTGCSAPTDHARDCSGGSQAVRPESPLQSRM